MSKLHTIAPHCLALAAALLLIAGTGRVALGQQDDDDADAAAANAMAVQQNAFMLSDQNFDQWVYGGGRNATTARSRLDSLLMLQIEDVERTCALTEAQKKKLQLAGRGDIKRFFDQVEEKRKKFQLLKADRNKINDIFQELQPLQIILNSGPFGEGSIFAKTIRATLNPEQAARYDRVILEKRLFRYRSKVELAVAMLDNSVGLSADQRRRFVALLLEDTQPPKKFGQYDYYVVMYQASKLSEDKLKAIFDDAQWRLLTQQFQQAKGMEEFLKNGEFLPARVMMMPPARVIVIQHQGAAAEVATEPPLPAAVPPPAAAAAPTSVSAPAAAPAKPAEKKKD